MHPFQNRLFTLVISILIVSCVPVEKEDLSDIALDINEPLQRTILDHQDRQNIDSLLKYLHHEDATYRYLAIRAFGSIKDHEVLDSLTPLLFDEVPEIRQAAAYAMGQSGKEEAEAPLISAFDAYDSLRMHDDLNAQVLEGIGRVGSETSLENIATVSTYLPTDTTLLEGQAWAIYRFGLRGKISEAGTERMVELIKGKIYPPSVRKIAANYLMRVRGLDLSESSAILLSAFNNEENPNLRMCLAIALGKCGTETARRSLAAALQNEKDFRVRCNILRGLSQYNLTAHQDVVTMALSDENILVAQLAADLFYKKGNTEDANDYKKLARDTSLHWSVRTHLYAAAQKHLPFYYSVSKGAINWDLTKWLNSEKDPYIIGAIVKAISEDPKQYGAVLNALDHEHPFVATTAAGQLKYLLDHDEFDIVFVTGKGTLQRAMNAKIEEKMRAGDAGMVAELTKVIGHERLQPFGRKVDYVYLDTVLLQLSLPEHIETYNMLSSAIARVNGQSSPQAKKVLFNHPIDWSLLDKYSDDTKAVVTTEKGEIELTFLPMEAPGSVVNFIDLTERGYFDGKNFHRVVPNFVVQGGCTRGDGYGSLNYTIRSELPFGRRYEEAGMVGMASAGNHTECTQWFITHCPTPHLDGNYTIFATVSKGMDVVNKLEQSDVIQSVKLINYGSN